MSQFTRFMLFIALTQTAFASPDLINGRPVGDMFRGVGMFNLGCTITKVGERQFITAAHCVNGKERALSLTFKDHFGVVKVKSLHIHPSWIKDCAKFRCTGKEVGGPNMTQGRSDVAFINVVDLTPAIPVINILYQALNAGTEVAMVGGGCTGGVEPGGRSDMRYAITQLVSHEALEYKHSLYAKIADITGQSNWITHGYDRNKVHASLCPGDSGGPLLSKNSSDEWEIVGIAADYTFNGPYQDGAMTITNLHTRLDDESLNNIGEWIRSVWE